MSLDVLTVARCKECKCIFLWNLKNAPGVDAEILFTFEKCIQKEKHECIDEMHLDK